MAVDFLRLRSDATSEWFLVRTRMRSKDVLGTLILHAARPLVATPEPASVQELLPLSLAGLGQQLGARKTLQKHPGRDRSPILKGL